jgi:hypothetical protein
MLTDIHRETVNKVVAPEKSGVLRKSEVVIKEEGTGRVVFQPPPYFQITDLLNRF